MRQEIYDSRSKLKGTNIYVHEDLTKSRQELLNKTRRSAQVLKVWTNDGRITAFLKSKKKETFFKELSVLLFCFTGRSSGKKTLMKSLILMRISAKQCGQSPFISTTSRYFTSAESGDSFFACFRSAPDLDATVSTGRYVYTMNYLQNNPNPPVPLLRSRNSDSSIQFHQTLLSDTSNHKSFGAFYCSATKDGQFTVVPTIFLRSDARFVPAEGRFSKTVNAGDVNVTVDFSPVPPISDKERNWRHNGTIDMDDLLLKYTGATSNYTIVGEVTPTDGGVYELHLKGERGSARAGLMRLIVRDCPAGRHDVLGGCLQACQSCYNGGICHSKTGECVCPPGFMGDQCEQLCGGNRHGQGCEYRCDYNSDDQTACRGLQVCVPDPYGCSCTPGYKGINCTQECGTNEFGASCTQTCHCVSGECDPYTGACTGSSTECQPNWTGPNCQECITGKYGQDCAGTVTVNYRKPNQEQQASVTCSITGSSFLSTADPIVKLQRKHRNEMFHETGVTRSSAMLPQLPSSPVVDTATSSSVTLAWDAWNGETDVGDPPLFGYQVYYKEKSNPGDFIRFETRTDRLAPSETITNLTSDTDYLFAVSAERPGVGGIGNKMEVEGRTLCSPPSEGPSSVEAVNGSRAGQITVLWQNPTNGSNCRSGFTGIRIYYVVTGGSSSVRKRAADMPELYEDVPFESPPNHTLTGLKPSSQYTINVVARNQDSESPRGQSVVAFTLEQDPASGGASTAVIAGAIIATIILLVLIVLLVFFIARKRKREGEKLHEEFVDNVVYESSPTNLPQNGNGQESGVGHRQRPPVQRERAVTLQKAPSPAMSPTEKSMTLPVLRAGPNVAPFAAFPNHRSEEQSHHCTSPLVEEVETSNLTDGDIYENVSLPGPVTAETLVEYVQSKKARKEDGFLHDFGLLPVDEPIPQTVASKPENKVKNRFKNIVTYDHSRVVLKTLEGDPHSDYYNASIVRNHKGEKMFIASQAPNTASIEDFWRMIWEQRVNVVVMVTNTIEAGKDRCTVYWPEKMSSSVRFGQIDVTLRTIMDRSDSVHRVLDVRQVGGSEKLTVHQFHFLLWPDMGSPQQPTTLLSFTRAVKQAHQKFKGGPGGSSPILVHCSAGVGRTGTFITLYCMLDQLQEEGRINIFGFIKQMREDRPKMVQTADQYIFLHTALVESYLSGNTEIPVREYQDHLMWLHQRDAQTNKLNVELEFEVLTQQSNSNGQPTFKAALEDCNIDKNRYQNVLPMERNRPYLVTKGEPGSTDYINASFLNTFMRKDVFVATQMPLPHTRGDIWRLVYDWKCPAIIMLNRMDENDESCAQYWPNQDSAYFGPLCVTITSAEVRGQDYVVREFHVKGDEEEAVVVKQYELLGWEAGQARPPSVKPIVAVMDAACESVKRSMSTGPIILHCMNGVGRSGVFAAVCSAAEKMISDSKIDIFQAVMRLRANRANMVESLEQYMLCYDALAEHMKKFEEYSNLDL
ncbi:uncharacterized protein [Diadema setosum]|uniref:uncharacterized protein n=1 Tax=Diadema setosum TaxID=31175 RepID=UPI003B3B1134